MPEKLLTVGEFQSWLEQIAPADTRLRPVTQNDVDTLVWPYQQESRSYHNGGHRVDMGDYVLPDEIAGYFPDEPTEGLISKKQAQAINAISGNAHDTVYMHVDGLVDPGRALPQIIKDKIGDLIQEIDVRPDTNGNNQFFVKATLNQDGKIDDELTGMLADIFGERSLLEGAEGLEARKGGNEFLSALVIAKTLEEKGLDKRLIAAVAISANIAATIPFRSATESADYPYPDGHMGDLANNLKKIDALNLNWNQVNQIMTLATDIANRDIAAFFHDDFRETAHNALRLLMEDYNTLRPGSKTTIQDLMESAGFGRSATKLYDLMMDENFEHLHPENIPHFYILRDQNGNTTDVSTPPREIHEHRIQQTKNNLLDCIQYSKMKKVGIATAAAIATAIGEHDAPVPGFVRGYMWESEIPEQDRKATLDDKIYRALKEGRGRGAIARHDIHRSPIAAFMYEAAGQEKMEGLYQQIKLTERFDEDDRAATNFLKSVSAAVGRENFQSILDELARVAKHPNKDIAGGEDYERAAKISRLGLKVSRGTEHDGPS